MNLFFLIDDCTDTVNAAVTKELVDITIDALQNPHKVRPKGESILGEIARQSVSQNYLIITYLKSTAFLSRFWARAIQTASLPSQRRFLDRFTKYLRALVVEALDREQGHCRGMGDYLKLRRYTIGTEPSFLLCEMGMNLPDEVFCHPVIMELAENTIELSQIDNVKSY